MGYAPGVKHARTMVALAVAALGCGGPSTGVPGAQTGGERASDGPCGAHEAELAGTCWSAEGTRWTVEADGPGGVYRFDVELMAAGRVRSTDHGAASPAHDEWFQDGELLRIFLADRFVEYRARVSNGTVLLGEATNVRGQQWSWRADRVFGEAPCQEGEARVDGACMTVAGTRWRLAPQGGEARFIEFLEGGRLGTGGRRDDTEAPGTWEQTGATLRFSLADGGAEHVAELTDDAAFRGTRGDDASFEATRVISVPPVVHR